MSWKLPAAEQGGCSQVIHPEAVHYPSIHRSKKTVEEVIAALKVNVETGLDSETAAELLKEDMELDKGGEQRDQTCDLWLM